jgi:Uma2 family endonuclease
VEARDVQQMSYAEYVAAERTATVKHEYVNGRVYAMAGGSPEHARLALAVGGELRQALRGQPCAVFSSDLRVRIPTTGRSTYPDVTVVCGALQRATDDEDAVVNPTVIVEVLSDTTEKADRSDKWAHYQRLPSLREYVLVSQADARIEVYSRDPATPDVWQYRDHGHDATVHLPSLELAFAVDDVYADPLRSR